MNLAITLTCCNVSSVSAVAKRKSLFDDKAVEIEELTYIIKQDINSLNKQIAQLQDFVRAKGSQSGRHLQTHSNTIVVSLQSKLASMSNDFKSVLEVRTEVSGICRWVALWFGADLLTVQRLRIFLFLHNIRI